MKKSIDKKVKADTEEFQKEMKDLFDKYDIQENAFILSCTSCGSPLVKIHLWNPRFFTRICQDCGYKEMYRVKQMGKVTDGEMENLL